MGAVWKSNQNPMFRSKFAEDVFLQKYAHESCETWADLCRVLVEDVCGPATPEPKTGLLYKDEREQLIQYMIDLKFIPGGRYLYYCFDPKEKILKQDYTWDKAENIKVGDVLVGFDEEIKNSKFKPTIVTSINRITQPRYKVQTTLGSVIVSDNHSFVAKPKLVQKKKKDKYQWIKAKDLAVGNVIAFSTSPWEIDTSYDAGWLSGILDGEGTVSKGSISVSQKEGAVLSKIEQILTEKNIKFYTTKREDQVCTVYIRGRWESVKVLGMFRPLRLLENWSKYNLGSFWSRINPPAIVENIEYLGEGEVCAIETSEKTLIGAGFLSHNCGRDRKFFNNCYLLKAEEDNREDWAELSKKSELCLSTGGGIGIDYSVYRASGNILHGTGGIASGPLAKMEMVNAQGRGIMQGGSRRSAIYASLNHTHGDIEDFLVMKNWYDMQIAGTDKSIGQLKEADFNYIAPMDMTNISVNYDTDWLVNYWSTGDYGRAFYRNCEQALRTGEPGFSFNFFDKENETLRNACTEVTSEDDSDVCNLGSINFGRIDDILELADIVRLATAFLLCGTLKADLPYEKVKQVREKNRRLGLGIMGLHEWLVKKGYKYEIRSELKRWLSVYEANSDSAANDYSNKWNISRPVAVRAIAPTGSIGILAGTSTGIEPIFAVAYKRRYLKGKTWHYQYVVDSAAQELIEQYGVNPNDLESSLHLAKDYERRIELQAEVQEFVDQGISSTINLPPWGSSDNNSDIVSDFAAILAKHSHRLRGFTCYPDGSRGGQPLVEVPYKEAVDKLGEEFEENIQTHDLCDITGKGGVCGV